MNKLYVLFLCLTAAAWVCADDKPDNRHEVTERFERMRVELLNDFNNHLITADQFNTETAKLDQLKIQEHADATQNNNTLSDDQRGMYNDLLTQIQREIEQLETATAQPANTTIAAPVVAPAQIPQNTDQSGRQKLYDRFQTLHTELTDDLNNQLITPDQFNTEIAKLNQLKIQGHADATQDLLKGQPSPYNEQLDQIQRDIDQMVQAK